ncbi:hypothetical protein MTR_7g068370 [Medicago truncatula]|uniref:Protein FAR1-RELATED SEQUENCE n=1 Tax=Medicago truncatula TaxID=3880 RepID=G7KSA0_MEDTR|nr:hypothetical protein MTR_7g068370 [Medicago truncatula]
MNSDIEQAYIDNCNRFKAVCDKFPMFLEYVETTISSLVKEKVGKFWVNQVMHMRNTTTNIAEFAHSRLKKFKGKLLWSKLIRKISRNDLHYLVDKADWTVECGSNKFKCGCLIFITYGLLCACTIAKKIRNNTTLGLDEIHTHWKRLWFEYKGDPKDRKRDISLLLE